MTRRVLPGSRWLTEFWALIIIADADQFGEERWTRYCGSIVANGVSYQTKGSKPEAEILSDWIPAGQAPLFGGNP